MHLLISTFSQTPIYEQIKTQIKELVLSGKVQPGEQLPSIRLLAKDLKVGIITVKRAYDDLCNEGLAVSVGGRGVFIADIDKEKIKRIHLQILRERLDDIKDFCVTANITQKELEDLIKIIYGGENHE